MKIKRQACLLLALMLCSCSGSISADKEISNELILKDNSGIASQLSTQNQQDPITKNKEIPAPKKLNYSEQKGMWLSYIDLNELLYQKTEEEFKSKFDEICKNCTAIDVNTLYIHCRAFGDAFYNSKLYQKTKTFGNTYYDPLKLMTDIAHKHKLSVHAWLNPLRCETAQYLDTADESLTITKWYKTGDDRLKYIAADDHYWLDPAYDDVLQLICDGVGEIIDNYDIDGIHFDDYFYPTTDSSFDSVMFSLSNENDLKKWRTDNINKLVSEVYKTVKEHNSEVEFGISPQGNIQNNYEYMYADVGKWCSEKGYIDYIVPQIYFGFENSILPYDTCKDEWSSLIKNKSVRLIIGLAAYKIYSDDEFIQKADILSAQITHAKSLENYSGYAFYNYISLFPTDAQKAQKASAQLDNIKKKDGN